MAVAALGLSACNDDKLVPDNGNADGKFVTVHFGAEAAIEGATKATLTPDEGETAFQAAWENGDELKVKYSNNSGIETATGTTTATWKSTSFESTMPEYTGMWIYDAAYPVPASDNSVDFGPNRTQKGNAYNSRYDIMIGSAVAKNAAAGKDDSKNDIIFQMDRQTAIAYFHFTSELDEVVTSATLKVTDGAIANSSASINEQFKFVAPQENDLTEINLTFEEGTAPSAKDFQLWFNVLPTIYKSITLTVETATKTFTISKDATENLAMYEAGKLYKVKKNGIAWTDKAVTPSVSVVNVDNVNVVKAMGNGSYEDYKKVQTITVDGLEYSMTNICANSRNGQKGYLMAAKQFIQMQKNTSYIFNTKSGVTNIKAWVLPKTTDAISVYQGSTSGNISSFINKPDKTTEIVKLISNSDREVDTQLDVYEYTITDGFFKLAPSATLWLYKLEVTYSNSGSSEPAPCETPVITLDGAVATITCATEGATIRYTLNGTDPVEASEIYSDVVTLTDGQTIKAKAFLTGHKPSEVASKTYTGGKTKYFVKVTSVPADWSGEYLIVCEDGAVAFDGSLADLDVAENTVAVTISDNKIEATDDLMKSVFTIDGTAIKSASGKYIFGTKGSNSLKISTTAQNHTLSIDKSGNFSAESNTSVLRYNSKSYINKGNETGLRFRYYKSTSYSDQGAIQLYKLDN